jgi:hypothetical protein
MWLTTGSILTKSIVQICVWEWVSLWMALSMVIATLSYNGGSLPGCVDLTRIHV